MDLFEGITDFVIQCEDLEKHLQNILLELLNQQGEFFEKANKNVFLFEKYHFHHFDYYGFCYDDDSDCIMLLNDYLFTEHIFNIEITSWVDLLSRISLKHSLQ